MAEWIKLHLRLRKLLGLVKDQMAVGRAIARSKFKTLRVAVIRATTHEDAPPDEKYVSSVLSAGSSSRTRVSYCIRVIMNRLKKTKNWAVALKCLILIHRGLQDGGFVFQDQLRFYPTRGGRNYLNLSKFKDRRSPFTWEASSWIRWYAMFLDQWLLTCRSLGDFLESRNSHTKFSTENIPSLATQELVREILALQDFLQEACVCHSEGNLVENALVQTALRLVILDSFKTQEELKVRMNEIPKRVTNLQRSEAFQLLQVCEKLSMQSMKLLHLLKVGQDLNLLRNSECPEKILFTDYELVAMRDTLRAASTRKSAPVSAIRLTAPNNVSFQSKRPAFSGFKRSAGFSGRTGADNRRT